MTQPSDSSEGTALVPAIEEWWPELDIEHKQALKESPVLRPDALRAITVITGRPVPDGDVLLSEHDREFIRTQSEMVD